MFDNGDGSYNVKIQTIKNDRAGKTFDPISDDISY